MIRYNYLNEIKMQNSVDDFLGHKLPDNVSSVLNKYGDSIDKLVRFGSELIEWDWTRESDEKKDAYLVPILFLRNLIENIDAMGILIRQGASDPAKSLLRTVVENFFSLEYLLSEKEHERCMSFHIWNTYHQYKLYEKLDGTSVHAKQLDALFKKDELLKSASPLILETVDKMKANAKVLLALPLYQEFAAELERTKLKLKKNNPHWYSLYDGPTTVENLANSSAFPALYEVYRGLSNTVHGVDIIQGKIAGLGDGMVGIDQLRFPKNAHSMTQYAHSLCIVAFTTYIKSRLPERNAEFTDWFNTIKPFRDELAKGDPISFS